MNIKAFIDLGYEKPHTFCLRFLQSPDFLATTISNFATSGTNKESKAVSVADGIFAGSINEKKVLLALCKQPRLWFTYKKGAYTHIPKLKKPSILFNEFGRPGWYGPIHCKDERVNYYIRAFKINYYTSDNDGKTRAAPIRWLLIGKVEKEHISFYWNGFSTNHKDRIESSLQFTFWNYIPDAITELEEELEGDYEYETIHKLILRGIWDDYIQAPDYIWRHLAVRAEASGVNLNARSKGVKDINVKGLLSLANTISEQLIKDILPASVGKNDKDLLVKAQNSVLRTLIHRWGTKSYEFSINKAKEKLFKSHCFFGLKTHSQTQDRFPHFKCFREYGGTEKTFEFLLDHSN